MILGEAFNPLETENSLAVMLRVLLEQRLLSKEVDPLFEQQAQSQYQRTLLFGAVVNLMSLAVCGISPSINAAYRFKANGIRVSVQSAHSQLISLESQIVETLVRHMGMKTQIVSDSTWGSAFWLLRSFVFPSSKSSVSNLQLAQRVSRFAPDNSPELFIAVGGI